MNIDKLQEYLVEPGQVINLYKDCFGEIEVNLFLVVKVQFDLKAYCVSAQAIDRGTATAAKQAQWLRETLLAEGLVDEPKVVNVNIMSGMNGAYRGTYIHSEPKQ